ncbi:MAG: CBS domain-containing protein [Myxococcales bacterium FL481]|nr:MAG: CBS domain-containing protein [Myxococcales bacterium FL481]
MSTLANYLEELGTLHQLDASASVRQAVLFMCERRVGALAVTVFGEIVGVLTERDVLKRGVAAGVDLDETPAYEVMTPMLVTAEITDSVDEAVEEMQRAGSRHVVVQHPRHRADFVGFLCRDELLLAEHRRRSRRSASGVPTAVIDDGTGSVPIDLAA